VPRAR
jgi:integrase